MSHIREDLLNSVDDWAEIKTIIPTHALHSIQEKTPKIKKENISWGDDLIKEKEKGIIRIYFININGACKQNNWEEYKRTIEVMKENEVDIFAFAETNIAWNPQTQNIAKRITEQAH